MIEQTAAESKAQNIQVMGEDLGLIYDALWQQVTWLHRKWSEYVALFGTKESRVVLLNKSAPSFMRIIQDSLWEDVLLHIARLTDPPKSAGKSNLTVQQLASLITHAETKIAVDALTSKALIASEFCRDWRNRHIAHRDLRLALDLEAEPLKSASREKVSEALKALASILNTTSNHFHKSTTAFDFFTERGSAMSLLYFLDLGLNAEYSRRERLKNGNYDPNEYKPNDL